MGTISTTKVLKNSGGNLTEETTLSTSVGSSDADKLIVLNASGILDDSIINASVTSSPNKIPKLNNAGTLDITVLPTGIGPDTAAITASEALSAGDLINVWNSAGDARARRADASTSGKLANGFVLASVLSAGVATVYFEGTNTACSGLVPGDQFLSSTIPGRTTSTAPTSSGNASQCVGFAISPTSLNFQYNRPIIIA
jgi:hypothetical protein